MRQHWIEQMKQPFVAKILAGVEAKPAREVEIFELYNIPTGESGKCSIAASR